MSYRYTVLGAGRQGAAIAYDLVKYGEAREVTLVDRDEKLVHTCAQTLNRLLGSSCILPHQAEMDRPEKIRPFLQGRQATVSALPYFLNPAAAQAAVMEKTHFTDLGGNTSIVKQELALDAQAREAKISLLPDCGLAPGLSNLLAAKALSFFTQTDEIRVRCGGIPQNPRPPFFYKMVFSIEGLLNEYSGTASVIRDGRLADIPALSELEEVVFEPLGKLEAAVTTGGTSTAPESFLGRVRHFDYKTLRHPGHWSALRAFQDLGLLKTEPLQVGSQTLVPRDVLKTLLEKVTSYPEDRDMVVLFMEARGQREGKMQTLRISLLDRGDEHFSAMERTTGFPTSTTAYLQVTGQIPSGARPIETCVPVDLLLEGLKKRGLQLREEIR